MQRQILTSHVNTFIFISYFWIRERKKTSAKKKIFRLPKRFTDSISGKCAIHLRVCGSPCVQNPLSRILQPKNKKQKSVEMWSSHTHSTKIWTNADQGAYCTFILYANHSRNVYAGMDDIKKNRIQLKKKYINAARQKMPNVPNMHIAHE